MRSMMAVGALALLAGAWDAAGAQAKGRAHTGQMPAPSGQLPRLETRPNRGYDRHDGDRRDGDRRDRGDRDGHRDWDRDGDHRGDRGDRRDGWDRQPNRLIILGDGSLLADLGYGYQQVIRSCSQAGSMPYGTSGTVITGGGGTLQPLTKADTDTGWMRYSAPAYKPPVANVSPRSQAPCWTTDGYGRVVIVQP